MYIHSKTVIKHCFYFLLLKYVEMTEAAAVKWSIKVALDRVATRADAKLFPKL